VLVAAAMLDQEEKNNSKSNTHADARIFIPHKLFSQDRLQSYLSNKELGFGRQVFESGDYIVYNTVIELVIHELVSDGTILKQQKESTHDNPEERYEATKT
jgi:hypothetical protein